MSMVTVTVTGLDRLRVVDPRKAEAAMKRGMKRAVVLGANQVKREAPVDTGRLRASVTDDVRAEGRDIVGVIGSNVEYAPSVEYGTGTQSDGQGGSGGVHFPPPHALQRWAERHGFNGPNVGFLVARAIARRGGLRPRRMFRRVMESPWFEAVVGKNVKDAMDQAFKA